jgi:pimeloyl-ACP methyl ester carboxylesterase
VCRDGFAVRGAGPPVAVLLPGWATDGRMVGGLFPGASVVLSGPLRPDGFPDRLAAFLDQAASDRVTVVGWSLGGFLAAEFARRHPGKVRALLLIGVRRGYAEADIETVRASLARDRRSCLAGFYAQCFFPSEMAAYRRFRAGLQDAYLDGMDDESLGSGLSYLAAATLSAASFPRCPVAIVHGEKDVVAPPAEAQDLARECGASFRLLRGAPHAAFLSDGFGEVTLDG